MEYLELRRIRSADRPARSQSIHRLSYPDPNVMYIGVKAVGA